MWARTTMIAPHRRWPAYRTDSTATSAMQSGWLVYATVLDQVSAAASGDMSATERLADAYGRLLAIAESYALRQVTRSEAVEYADASEPVEPERNGVAAILSLTREVAHAAERAGALQTSYSLLATLDRIPYHDAPVEYGRGLAQRARVARKADSLDVAETLYRRVSAIGRECKSPELEARALIGRGIVAQTRGNHPAAHRLFTIAARMAERAGRVDLVRLAHHTLMVLAARRAEGHHGAAVPVRGVHLAFGHRHLLH